VFLTVLDDFLLTSVQVWEKNSDLKNLSIPTSSTIQHISFVPWCVGLDRFRCISISNYPLVTSVLSGIIR